MVFSTRELEKVIEAIRPDVLTKGSNYENDIVIGRELVGRLGGRMALIPVTEEVSSPGSSTRSEAREPQLVMLSISTHCAGLSFKVQVQPGAACNRIVGLHGETALQTEADSAAAGGPSQQGLHKAFIRCIESPQIQS